MNIVFKGITLSVCEYVDGNELLSAKWTEWHGSKWFAQSISTRVLKLKHIKQIWRHSIEAHSLAKWWEHEQCNHPLILFAKCFVWNAAWAFARNASTRTHDSLSLPLSRQFVFNFVTLPIIVRPMELALCECVLCAVRLIYCLLHIRAHIHTLTFYYRSLRGWKVQKLLISSIIGKLL